MKEENGCNGPSEIPYLYPPSDAVDGQGHPLDEERVEINTCPVNLITPDLIEFFRAINLADGRISISEQDWLPYPFIQAVAIYSRQSALASADHMRRKRSG